MQTGPRQTAIEFRSGGEPVQGVLSTPVDGRPPYPGAAVCHAHPLFGGNMDSPLIFAICRALADHGVASLRFNFRPFGEGATEAGGSACEDAAAALKMLRDWHEVRSGQCGLAGYSAGAAAIARGLDRLKAAKALALIAPPLSAVRSSGLARDRRPKLFVVGVRDKIVSHDELSAIVSQMAGPSEIALVEGDHNLRGQEEQVAAKVAAFLGERLRR